MKKTYKKKILMMEALVFVLALTMVIAGCGDGSLGNDGYQQVSAEEAVEMMENEEGYIILDVRTAEEYAEKHIPEAVNVPVESIGSEEPAELPDKEQKVFVYCRSGNRSKQASEKLVKLGYVNIIEFGGINSWTGETVSGE